jgi:hypothetical protein
MKKTERDREERRPRRSCRRGPVVRKMRDLAEKCEQKLIEEALRRLAGRPQLRVLASQPNAAVLTVVDPHTMSCFLSPAEMNRLADQAEEFNRQQGGSRA